MSQQDPTSSELHLFQTLQQAEQTLWQESLTVGLDEDHEVSRWLAQEQSFQEARRNIREQLAADFDVPFEQLRNIELQGLLQGWTLEST